MKKGNLSKKADKIYVDKIVEDAIKYIDKGIENSEQKTDLKIEIVLQSNEELRTTVETMARQVQIIYEKHYRP